MRFSISFGGFSKFLLAALGCGPGRSWAELDAGTLRARLGWSGSVTIPRTSIVSVERVDRVPFWLGIGVHGMKGKWALNGSNQGVVRLDLNGPARGRVLFVPFKPTTLYLSLEDPQGFVSAVSPLTRS